jgi:hypothetical protein
MYADIPLEDGLGLLRVPVSQVQDYAEGYVEFEIVFGDDSVLRREPVMKTLYDLAGGVRVLAGVFLDRRLVD